MSDTELTSGDFTESAEPFRLFAAWLDDATKSEPNDPNGLALATVDEDGMPDVRMVLLKGFDEQGFVFYTNFESAKGREILSVDEGGDVLPLEVAAPAGADARTGRGGQRRRSRRLFQDAAARQPDRRLGLEAVAAAGKPLRAGKGGGGIHGKICDRRDTAARALVGLSASCRGRSNSGTTGRSGCTTASCSRGRARAAGRRRGFIRRAPEPPVAGGNRKWLGAGG